MKRYFVDVFYNDGTFFESFGYSNKEDAEYMVKYANAKGYMYGVLREENYEG